MSTPTVYELFTIFKRAEGRPVTFFEIRAAYPYVKPGSIRARCCKLIRQGYILKLDGSDAYVFVGSK